MLEKLEKITNTIVTMQGSVKNNCKAFLILEQMRFASKLLKNAYNRYWLKKERPRNDLVEVIEYMQGIATMLVEDAKKLDKRVDTTVLHGDIVDVYTAIINL